MGAINTLYTQLMITFKCKFYTQLMITFKCKFYREGGVKFEKEGVNLYKQY